MAKNPCIICNQRRGKRWCPALNGHICSYCCGSKRGEEIRCPSNCPYWMEGKNYKATKGEGSKKPGQVENKEVLVDTLTTILEVKDRFPELDDTDVEEGLNLVVKTYETRQKGLIYEHKSTVPQVTALSYRLRTVLNWRIEGGKGYDDRVSLGEVVSTLEKVITKVTSLRQKGDSPTPFLDLLAQYRGKGEGTTLELP